MAHKVLLVDDEEEIRDILSSQMKDAGFEAFTAATAEEAKRVLQSATVQCCVVDVLMPGLTGLELLGHLRVTHRDLPVIMMTGAPDLEAAVDSIKAGAYDYVVKPVTDKDLPRIVGRAIERQMIEATARRGELELSLLYQVSQSIGYSLSFDTVLDLIRDAFSKVVHNEAFVSCVIDRHRPLVTIHLRDGLGGDTSDALCTRALDRLREMLAVSAPLAPPAVSVRSLGAGDAGPSGGPSPTFRSTLEVPLKSADEVFGLVIAASLAENAFSEPDSRFLQTLANQASTAFQKIKALLTSEQSMMKALVESMTEGVVMLGRDGEVLTANPAAQALLAVPEAGTVLDRVGDIPIEELIAAAERGEHALTLGADMRRAVLVRAASVIARGETMGIVLSLADVTRLHEAQKQERMLQRDLAQSSKMAALGQMAGGIAHDFNNLLLVMMGYCDLAKVALKDGDVVLQHVERIQGASRQAAGLIKQLLAFSRGQILQPQVIDLNAVVTESEQMLRRLIAENIQLSTIRAVDLWRVKADPGQIGQVVLNLAINARDAMPRGGTLTLATANAALDETTPSRPPSVPPGSYVRLSVSDTGSGMDPETAARIFEPFFTTKSPEKGTGLGLATVYGIITQSEGRIVVESAVGHGTTFAVYLPRVLDPLDHPKSREASTDLRGGSETILIVEDSEDVRLLARTILERMGYTVLDALSADSAQAICRQHSGDIHLVLTDVVLPGTTGPALARMLAEIRPKMKVLAMSGYTRDAISQRVPLALGTSFIAKPFSAFDLIRKVRRVLDGAGSTKSPRAPDPVPSS